MFSTARDLNLDPLKCWTQYVIQNLQDYNYMHRMLATGKPPQSFVEHNMSSKSFWYIVWHWGYYNLQRLLCLLLKIPLLIVTSTDFFFGFKYDFLVISKKKKLSVHFAWLEKEVKAVTENEGQMPIDISF